MLDQANNLFTFVAIVDEVLLCILVQNTEAAIVALAVAHLFIQGAEPCVDVGLLFAANRLLEAFAEALIPHRRMKADTSHQRTGRQNDRLSFEADRQQYDARSVPRIGKKDVSAKIEQHAAAGITEQQLVNRFIMF